MQTLYKGGDTAHTLRVFNHLYHGLVSRTKNGHVVEVQAIMYALLIKLNGRVVVRAMQNARDNDDWTMAVDGHVILAPSHNVVPPKPTAHALQPPKEESLAQIAAREQANHPSANAPGLSFWDTLLSSLSFGI